MTIAAAATALLASTTGTSVAAPPPEPVVSIALPAPTGPSPAGVTEWHLTDASRTDPWTGDPREVLAQIWYPATEATGERAPWMPQGGRAEQDDFLTELGVPAGTWNLAPSHSHTDAPARHSGGIPVLLNSPGMGDATGWSTAQAEDLASHGYAVVALNHTHEAFSIRFPDGRTAETRVADTRFVLDQLSAAAAGQHDGAALPAGLARNLDLSRVAMFGHSLGGSTTIGALQADPRIRAGVNLDGPVLGPAAETGIAQPLLMLAGEFSPWFGRPGWEPYWHADTGIELPLRVLGSEHMSFCDQQLILARLAEAGLLAGAVRQKAVGGIDADRSIELQRTYLRTWFDAVFGRGDLATTITGLARPEVVPYP
ncbi:alpha/beta hydrolase family protein [Nocardia jiangsuensis]|uniref:Alpha/beta hydrolase family protein n=1 Tax=Nocardia jiangsuensis TaxID=1691563 RepID=A0ABV8DM97_9NOCA